MEEYIGFIIIGLIITGFFLVRFSGRSGKKKEAYELFSDIAGRSKGLNAKKGRLFMSPRLLGDIDGVDLHGVLKCKSGKFSDTFFLVLKTKHKNQKFGSFSISQESVFTKMKKVVGIDDILIGDEEFDNEMLIKSSKPETILALLKHEVRYDIESISRYAEEMIIDSHSVFIKKLLSEVHGPTNLIRRIYSMSSISNAINNIKSIKDELVHNINNDKIFSVRERNLDMLLLKYKKDSEIESMLKDMLSIGSIEMQITVALHQGDTGLKHILSLIDRNRSIDDGLTIRIAEIFSERNFIEGIPGLKKLFQVTDNENVRIKICNAFQVFGDASVNSLLVEELNSSSSDLSIAIMTALGVSGTKEVIEPIYKKAKGSLNIFLRNAAQKSIGQIKSRLDDGDSGWLSVYELSEEEGKLSVSDEAGEGALSKDDE